MGETAIEAPRPRPPIKRRPPASGWILVGLVILAMYWVVDSAPSFKDCIHNQKDDRQYHQLHENGAVAAQVARWRLQTVCVEDWTERYQGAIGAVATLMVAAFTFTLWRATKRLWQSAEDQLTEFRRSLSTAEQHASHMAASVTEAGRSATAMEKVSESLAINATQIVRSVDITQKMSTNQREFWMHQMRTYISVNPGAVIDQDVTPGMRFESQPIIQNDGLTPAYELVFIAKTQLLPHPLPRAFDFDLTKEESPDTRSVTTMNPRNNSFMIITADAYYSPSEKEEYRKPGGRRLFTWGTVRYKDVNMESHYTNFCFFTIWGSLDKPISIRTTRHNDSN
jgi:hypothetical protein